MHRLSRDEIARLGIETRTSYETEWFAYEDLVKRKFMMKALTEAGNANGDEYRTTTISIGCNGGAPALFYQRELAAKEIGVPTAVHVAVGETRLTMPRSAPDQKADKRAFTAGRDFVAKALAARSIVLTETFSPSGAAGWSREVKLSAAGLEQGLDTGLRACSER
jgi:hypothetical protein